MSKSMLDKMDAIILKMKNMNQEEMDAFLSEGASRAAHVLSEVYYEDRDFRIIGEEAFSCEEIVNHQFSTTGCGSTYTYKDSSDVTQNPLLCMAA